MNRHLNDKSSVSKEFNFSGGTHQNDEPNEGYEEHENESNKDDIHNTKVNFEHNPYYDSDKYVHIKKKFYNNEPSAYSNYEDYKKYYLNPANPLPNSNVKFKISSRIVQTKYGKLQGIILAMDEHKYLRPLEVFLGVPYATPPVGSNR